MPEALAPGSFLSSLWGTLPGVFRGARCTAATDSDLVLEFPRELRTYEFVGGAQELGEFRDAEGFAGFERDPFCTGEVGGGNDVWALDELGEGFVTGLEGEADFSGYQRGDGKHLAADFEEQVVAPLDLLGYTGKGKTEFAKMIDVHEARFRPGDSRSVCSDDITGVGSGTSTCGNTTAIVRVHAILGLEFRGGFMQRMMIPSLLCAAVFFALGIRGQQNVASKGPMTFALECAGGDCPLLKGAPQTSGMRGGSVKLKPGESVGWHSTNQNEEALVILHGSGVAKVEGGADVALHEKMLAYIPPGTRHNVTNPGNEWMEYVWVVAPVGAH